MSSCLSVIAPQLHVKLWACFAPLRRHLTGPARVAGIAEMLVMTMPAQGAHELGEVAHAHLSGCADSGVEEQAGTVRSCSSMLLSAMPAEGRITAPRSYWLTKRTPQQWCAGCSVQGLEMQL